MNKIFLFLFAVFSSCFFSININVLSGNIKMKCRMVSDAQQIVELFCGSHAMDTNEVIKQTRKTSSSYLSALFPAC